MSGAEPSLQNDLRWQLIERITASSTFHKSERLRDLLRFLAEKTLRGATHDLSEHLIGVAVFGKPVDYSNLDDSSVRAYVRLLRLKLHEYFDSEGREETYVVEFPKGSYIAVFRAVEQTAPRSEPGVGAGRRVMQAFPWALAALFLIIIIVGDSFHRVTKPSAVAPPWPLSELFDKGNQPVEAVVSDANFSIVSMLSGRQVTLQEYLDPAFRNRNMIADAHKNQIQGGVLNYISNSVLTSFADVSVATTLTRMSGEAADRLVVRSARSLSPHDFDQGNFVLLGGPNSNPWVLNFQDKFNFREHTDAAGSGDLCFNNLHPQPGEQQSYCGLPFSGSGGVDYATISLFPLPNGRGNVMILRGLHQEGTEAAGNFLADANSRRQLQKVLGVKDNSTSPIYFEALIRTESVAGAPVGSTALVSVRLLQE